VPKNPRVLNTLAASRTMRARVSSALVTISTTTLTL
jgi:hypothetical protein